MAGALCGALVGSVTALLLTPASGEDLRTAATERWELAMEEARKAREEKQKELTDQFEQMKAGQA
jgi:gas vesicle protein